ncbi:hypothetical protein CRG98_023828 [Punica granatum]|uniref:Uncharacterized protein n=1 Tax=Punica granatum TaxID=22663 RepID=A0A2I0JHP9_PUNGR|nr:hypothetical protein CRG98_023828 [Punica granatum]
MSITRPHGKVDTPRLRDSKARMRAPMRVHIRRPPILTEVVDDLDGGVGIADWQLQPANRSGTSTRSPRSIRGLGPPPPLRSSVPTEDASNLGGGIGVTN